MRLLRYVLYVLLIVGLIIPASLGFISMPLIGHPTAPVFADTVVVFPDPGLNASIHDAIHKPSGDIYQADLDGLTTLNATSKGISDLTGLEHCTNLTGLVITVNNISDISALSGLTKLNDLSLDGNQISNIFALASLTNLQKLYLNNNQISDISALSVLTDLTHLDLEQNQISNISALSGLTNLATLDLYGNQISDISALSGLTNLTFLWLSNNNISDISALSGLTNLTQLRLGNNQISNISVLSGLTNLTQLWLGYNQISNISALSNLTKLNELDFGYNQISNISALSGLTNLNDLALCYNQISNISALSGLINLQYLYPCHNQISDIEPLHSLTNLKILYLFYNQISDISALSSLTNLNLLIIYDNNISNISALSGLTNLTQLSLSHNQISNISALSNLTNLGSLDFGNNQISNISALSNLTKLYELDFGYNQISNISALSGLTNLTRLWLYHNQISNISVLSGLTNLTQLWLGYNQISNISPLVNNNGLGTGDSADLALNNLNLSVGSQNMNDIQTLLGRGVTVDYIPQAPQGLVLNAGYDQTALEGADVQFSASVNVSEGWSIQSIVWNFGDGSTASDTLAPVHAYQDNGTYTVELTVGSLQSSQFLAYSDSLTVTVNNALPIVEAGPDKAAGVGKTINIAAQFSDPGSLDTHTATINWGDGAINTGAVTETGGSGSVSGSHAYSTKGVYTVTVTVVDKDGGPAADSLKVYVPLGMVVTATPDRVPEPSDVKSIDISNISVHDISNQYLGLQSTSLQDMALEQISLQHTSLDQVGDANFWAPILDGTPFHNADLSTTTLGDLLSTGIPVSYDIFWISHIKAAIVGISHIKAPIVEKPTQNLTLDQVGDTSFWGPILANTSYQNAVLSTTTLGELFSAGIPVPYDILWISHIKAAIMSTQARNLTLDQVGDTSFWGPILANTSYQSADLSTTTLGTLINAGIPLPYDLIWISHIKAEIMGTSDQYISLDQIGDALFWAPILDGTPFHNADLSTTTLGDLVNAGVLFPFDILWISHIKAEITQTSAQYTPLDQIGDASFWGPILANTSYQNADLSTTTLGTLINAGIPLPYDLIWISHIKAKITEQPIQSTPLNQIGDANFWAPILDGTPFQSADLSTTTLGTLINAGIPLPYDLIWISHIKAEIMGTSDQYTPLDQIGNASFWAPILDGTPFHNADLSTTTLGDLVRAGIPLPYDLIWISHIKAEIIGTPAENVTLEQIGNASFWAPILYETSYQNANLSTTTLGDLVNAGVFLPYDILWISHIKAAIMETPAQYFTLDQVGDADYWAPILKGAVYENADLSTTTLGDLVSADVLLPYDILSKILIAFERCLLQYSPQSIPWESVPLTDLPIPKSSVNYIVTLVNCYNSNTGNVLVNYTLPEGFEYVNSSTTFNGQTIADPEIQGSNLSWNIAPNGVNQVLEFRALASTSLGVHFSNVTATATNTSLHIPEEDNVAPATVIDIPEPNDTWTNATEITKDRLYLSYISTDTDKDWYKIPVPLEKGATVTVHLSHLPADYDLALFSTQQLQNGNTALQKIPMQNTPLRDIPVGVIPPEFTPVQDTELPDTFLQDISNGNTDPTLFQLRDISATRGTVDEIVATKVANEMGYYHILVSGFQGAHSNEPYVLRVEVTQPRSTYSLNVTLQAASPSQTNIDEGNTPPESKETLIVVNQQRLAQLYEQDAAVNLINHLTEFANLSNVKGAILYMDKIDAYADWDKDAGNTSAANAVAAAIKSAISSTLTSHPSIKYIVIVGNDEIIPFRRVPDETCFANENEYTNSAYLKPGPLQASLLHGDMLTDDYYADMHPISWMGRELYVPDYAIGRLVETPAEIQGMLQEFQDKGGVLEAKSALVTGYDGLTDGALNISATLSTKYSVMKLISETWDRSDLSDLFLKQGFNISSINAHCDHWGIGTPPGTGGDPLRTGEIAGATLEHGQLVFSMGCHAGLNVPDNFSSLPSSLDLPQALAQKTAWLIANTGYGYGDSDTIAFSEQLMDNFARALVDTQKPNPPVGQALVDAKQSYFLNNFGRTSLDYKVMIESELYGLPMYIIDPGAGGTTLSDPTPGEAMTITLSRVVNSIVTDSITYNQVLNPVVTPHGQYYAVNGETEYVPYRPLQPRVNIDISRLGQVAHGMLLTSGTYQDYPNFDPVITRPTVFNNEYEPQFINEEWYPNGLSSIMSLQTPDNTEQTLAIVPGQFITTNVSNKIVTGTERLYQSLNCNIYYSNSDDYCPPTIDSVDVTTSATTGGYAAHFWIKATDFNDPNITDDGIVGRVVVLWTYAIGDTSWELVDLAYDPVSGKWTGDLPQLTGGQKVEFIVQAVDGAGNVGLATNKGLLYSFLPGSYAIDVQPPKSQVVELQVNGNSIIVAWHGEDEAGGSGINSYDIYVSDDGGSFVPWLQITPATEDEDTFVGQVGHTYSFYSVARDNSGNIEKAPEEPDATATITPITYNLTYTSGPGGSISGDAHQTPNQGTSGTPVMALSDNCHRFLSWSDGVTTANRIDSKETNVVANFAIKTYNLTYTSWSGGSISGNASQTPNCGTSGTPVTAVADSCHRFLNWSDSVTTANRTDSVATDVTANFVPITYKLTYTAGTGGSISGKASQTVPCGLSGEAVTATPANGYRFVRWNDSVTTATRTDTFATTVTASFALKLNQTITFNTLTTKTYGNPDFAPGAKASSGLPVSYISSNTSVATIVGGNIIHIVGAGTSTITASQPGNSNYNAAASVARTLTVNKANQTITFSAPTATTYDNPDFAPGATTSSGLPVSYISSNPSVATIVGGNIHIVGAGTSTITASQPGNGNYNAAASVARTLTVNKASTTVALTSSTSNNTSCLLQRVTFTATVAAAAPGMATPTGTVTFKDGAITLGTGTLSSGKATFSTSLLWLGSNSITAVYNGNANFKTSTSPALIQRVTLF